MYIYTYIRIHTHTYTQACNFSLSKAGHSHPNPPGVGHSGYKISNVSNVSLHGTWTVTTFIDIDFQEILLGIFNPPKPVGIAENEPGWQRLPPSESPTPLPNLQRGSLLQQQELLLELLSVKASVGRLTMVR